MSEANKQLVRNVFDAINGRNLDAAIAAFAPDYVWQGPGGQQAFGPEGWRELVNTYIKAFPDMQLSIEELVAEGNKVVTRFTGHGTFQGELAGAAPTGRRVNVPIVMISRIENGKIAEDFEMWDQLAMFQDMGALAAITAHA